MRKLLGKAVVDKLANGEELPPENHDHPLIGNWVNHRECHIAPDWLLIYQIHEDILVLELTHSGPFSHSCTPSCVAPNTPHTQASTAPSAIVILFIVFPFLNHVFRFTCLTLTSKCDTIYVVFKQGEEYVTG